MAQGDIDHVTPQDVYRALSPTLAMELQTYCRITKQHPAEVMHDALRFFLDEECGELFDPAQIHEQQPSAAAGAAS